MRSDTRRNINRLIWSVGEVVREDPTSLSMNTVAARAEVAPATAYRYFKSVDVLVEAFTVDVVRSLADHTATRTEGGRSLYVAVLRDWYALVLEHGAALVQLRSRKGFLERLRQGDELIKEVDRAWAKPLQELMRAGGVGLEHYEMALFMSNLLTDPRELLDLHKSEQVDEAELVERLADTVLAAVVAWTVRDINPKTRLRGPS